MLNSTGTKLGTKAGIFSIKLFIAIVALIVSGACLGLGAIQGIIASAPDASTIDVSPTGFATKIYDNNGEEIQMLATTGSNRTSVSLDQIPEDLQHAFIAIEDERFYEHNGIDMKGIFRAVAITFSKGRLSQGASTISQQLLKNNYFNAYNETTIQKIKRKIQEQYLAVKLETVMTKQEILEDYLNSINLGNGYYGVQSAATGYFEKDVSELSLSECAVIASITQNPTKYNPAKNPEDNQIRERSVLDHMLTQGYITQDEYEEAKADNVYDRVIGADLQLAGSTYSYFVDALIDQISDDLREQYGYTDSQVNNLIYKGGLKINSTQDMRMQEIADKVINDPDYYPSSTEFSIYYTLVLKDTHGDLKSYYQTGLQDYFKRELGMSDFTLTFSDQDEANEYIDKYKEHLTADGSEVVHESVNYIMEPQMSLSIMDQHTGQVKVLVGGRGEKTGNRTMNRATDTLRQPGSSIKPLADYGPALDTGAITLATAIDDAPFYYSGDEAKLVKNYFVGEYRGMMSVRQALTLSQNVPAVKTLTMITPRVGFNYLEKFGISTLLSPEESTNGLSDMVQSLALGGLTYGVKNIEMCAAYATIANKGVYTKPIYYTTVETSSGEILLDNRELTTHRVMKESSAWLLTNALESVTAVGTGETTVLDKPAYRR